LIDEGRRAVDELSRLLRIGNTVRSKEYKNNGRRTLWAVGIVRRHRLLASVQADRSGRWIGHVVASDDPTEHERRNNKRDRIECDRKWRRQHLDETPGKAGTD
jgi:hypothetical protein